MASIERLGMAWFRTCKAASPPLMAWATMVLVLVTSPPHSLSAEDTWQIGKATSSRAAREDAVSSIPFSQLSKPAQARIADVVRKPSMFRRMPTSVIDCDPELHRFLVRYPEVVVNIWQLMGITKVTAERTAPYQLACTDGVGTVTDLELIYGNRDTHLIFCEGAYDGPLFRKPVQGRCVLLLKSGHVVTESGRQHITNRLDMFLQIDHAGVDVFTKTLHPLFGRSADINFVESMKFLQRVSRAAEVNGPGMQQLAERLDNVKPEVRGAFGNVVASVHTRDSERLAKSGSLDTTSPGDLR